MTAEKNIKSLSKRMISLVMLVAMLFNFAAQYALPVLSAENDSYIAVEGDRISDLSLADGEKILLDAVCETEEITRYSWQIRYSADPELWVNISGANGKLYMKQPQLL